MLVEPKIENKCKIFFFLLTVFNHVVLGWQEGQTDKKSRWPPRWVTPGWWVRIGGRCPFTIHVPSASANSDSIPVTKKEQRDGGRELYCHVRKPTYRFHHHPPLNSQPARPGSSFCSKLHYCYTGVLLCQY